MAGTLSSVLLRGVSATDNALDSIFGSTVVPTPAPVVAPKKRKADDDTREKKKSKRVKISDEEAASLPLPASAPANADPVSEKKHKSKGSQAKLKLKSQQAEEEPPAPIPPLEEEDQAAGEEEDWESDHLEEADDDALPVHESLRRPSQKKKLAKEQPSTSETKEERDARTVFVGNVPISVAKTQSLKKKLIRHLTSFIPGSHIESIRFRSVAFKAPTARTDDDGSAPAPTTAETSEKKKSRTQAWKESHAQAEAEGSSKPPPLSESEKKKVAFIKGEFHEEVDTLNAYAVFAHPLTTESDDNSKVPSATDAVRLAVEKANGSTFLEKTLRVDFVGAKPPGWGAGDPKSTVFVGNLDYATTEEALRSFFEELLKEDKGDPDSGSGWVKSVRLVRDKATKLGKGFAYVLFQDRDCVDYVLAADSARLKFAKRTLRVQRCKSIPTSKSPKRPQAAKDERAEPRTRPSKVNVPKGDPLLGERLAGMDKEARRAAKAADETRIARRLAKKRAKAGADKKKSTDKVTGKRPERVRGHPKLGRDPKKGDKFKKKT